MLTGLLAIATGVPFLVAFLLHRRPNLQRWFAWPGVAGLVGLAVFSDLSTSGRVACAVGALLVGGLQAASQILASCIARNSRRDTRL